MAWNVLMGFASGLCIIILISYSMAAICGKGKYGKRK